MFQSVKLAEKNRSQLTGAGGPTAGSSVRGLGETLSPRLPCMRALGRLIASRVSHFSPGPRRAATFKP